MPAMPPIGYAPAESPPRDLLPDEGDELRVRDDVAAAEAARLLREPEEPLEPGARIQRGARRVTPATISIEPPTPMTSGTPSVASVLGEPVLLARRRDGDEEDVRLRARDLGGDIRALRVGEPAVPRARDPQAGMGAAEARDRRVEHLAASRRG